MTPKKGSKSVHVEHNTIEGVFDDKTEIESAPTEPTPAETVDSIAAALEAFIESEHKRGHFTASLDDAMLDVTANRMENDVEVDIYFEMPGLESISLHLETKYDPEDAEAELTNVLGQAVSQLPPVYQALAAQLMAEGLKSENNQGKSNIRVLVEKIVSFAKTTGEDMPQAFDPKTANAAGDYTLTLDQVNTLKADPPSKWRTIGIPVACGVGGLAIGVAVGRYVVPANASVADADNVLKMASNS